MKERHIQALPFYLMLITANALPVYGAATGKIVFFQIIYLYWLESLLMIIFDCIKIAAARGSGMIGGFMGIPVVSEAVPDVAAFDFSTKLGLILKAIFIRTAILLFYLLFIVVFVGFRLTGDAHRKEVAATMYLQNPFVNAALLVFAINMMVQLLGGFFFNGRYKREAPHNFTNYFDGRTILMHVMIVGSVFIHQSFFEHKTYVATGEIVYVGIFMLIRTIMDIYRVRRHLAEQDGGMVMI